MKSSPATAARPVALRVAAFAALALLGACVSDGPPKDAAPPPRLLAAPIALDPLLPTIVVAAGPTPRERLEVVARLESEGRRAGAEALVRKDPSRVLAGIARHDGDSRTLQQAATAAERVLGTGWAALAAGHAGNAEATQDYDDARQALLDALRAGDATAGVARTPLHVPSDVPGSAVLATEAAALEAFARLAAGDTEAAAHGFETASRLAAGRDFETSRLGLLLAEAQRAGGTDASAAWLQAVLAACRMQDLVDPLFWQRALELRPAAAAWPPEALAFAVREIAPGSAAPPEDGEALVIGLAGVQLLASDRATEALLLLTRATAQVHSPRLRGALRLAQSRVLIALGSPGDASAALTDLGEDPDPLVARPALALLGALELKLARPERARPLLKLSLGAEGDPQWPGRTQAEANLGLAALMLGDKAEGLSRLHTAQARFEVERDFDALALSLRNELAWANEARDQDEAVRLRQRIDEVERR